MEDHDEDDGSNHCPPFNWDRLGRLYSLQHKRRLLGFAPHSSLTEVINAEFLRRAQLGELFQEPCDQERFQRRLKRAGCWEWNLAKKWTQPSGDQNNNNNNNNNNNSNEEEETPTTEITTSTMLKEDENCKKRTLMECYNNNHNNNRDDKDDDNQELHDDDDDKKNNIDNINMISPSPKRLLTRTGARNQAEENKAIVETTPTTTTGTSISGADSPAKPNETSPENFRQSSRTDPPGRCAGLLPHPIGEEIARANSCAPGMWTPMHTIFQWWDSEQHERMTILVVLPSGVDSWSKVAVPGGNKLELTVQWPKMIGSPDQFYELFQTKLEMERLYNGPDSNLDHGTLQDHMIQYQELCKHVEHVQGQRDDRRRESKAQIHLPKTVHALNIEIQPIGKIEDGTRTLYIDLICKGT